MFFLAYMAVKVTVKMTFLASLIMAWVACAMFIAPFLLAASIRGNQRAVRSWQRVLNWNGVFKSLL